ncbi:glycosyltransferase family 2 protein [Lysobacter sp. P5_B9]
MTMRDLVIRLRSLWQAARASLGRARAMGMPKREIFGRTMAALRRGPREFARSLVRFAWPDAGQAGAFAPELRDEYTSWLATIESVPACESRPAAGRVSVVMPVYNTPERFLREAYESVCAQTYGDWELCIHDDASDASWMEGLLAELERDSRVRVSRGRKQSGIAAATNAALAIASGRWVAFLDHDDLLHRDAIAASVARLVSDEGNLVYTDHDALDRGGRRCAPFFKPDWSPDLLLSQMYLGHLVVVERALVERVGGLRPAMDGAQDYDLLLRCVSAGAKVVHEPRVLYHWRQHDGSTSANADSKPYAHHAGRRALQDYVGHRYPGARVDDGAYTFCYDVRYLAGAAKASIIIPTRDRLDLLQPCIESLRELTAGQAYEIIIIDNGSAEASTASWLESMAGPGFRVIRADIPFNWSVLNNIGAREATGEVLVFLNNDTEAVQADWLARLVEVALRDDVGVCGPMLLYGDGSIQHAGVVVGMGGWADHVFKGEWPVHNQRLFVSPVLRRNVLAVTGACMAIEARKFAQLGGFDESFVVCGSDVELCLRAHRQDLLNVYVGESRMLHHESKTRDPQAIPETDFHRSAEAYAPYRTEGDPLYNRNLDMMSAAPRLRARP